MTEIFNFETYRKEETVNEERTFKENNAQNILRGLRHSHDGTLRASRGSCRYGTHRRDHLLDHFLRNSEHIGGGSVALYKVATADSAGHYHLTSDFANLTVDINAFEDTDESWGEVAEEVALYIKNHSLEDTAQIIELNEKGSARVQGLEIGLYIAIQKEAPRGYTSFKPFIIPLPYFDGNVNNYVLLAKPKGTSRLPAEELVLEMPVVRKTVRATKPDTAIPTDTVFRFSFKALQNGYPEVVNSTGSVENGGCVVSQTADEIIVRTVGEGIAEVGTITFDTPGDYYYEAREINDHASGYTYDKTVYWVKFEVRLNADRDKLVLSRVAVKYDNANGEIIYDGAGPLQLVFDFINYIDKPPVPTDSDSTSDTESDTDTTDSSSETETTPPPESESTPPSESESTPPDEPENNSRNDGKKDNLPQTGQVWWPMMVMLAAGILFIVIGVVVSKKSRRNGRNR